MSSCVTTHKLITRRSNGVVVERYWLNLATGLEETVASVVADLEAGLLATGNDCEDCDLFDYYTLEGNPGVDVQQWLDTAVEGAGLIPVLDVFTATDSEGYPAHPNLPDNVLVDNNYDINTSQTGSSHQSIYDGYVYFPEAGYLRDNDTTSEQGLVMIGLCCGPLLQAGEEWSTGLPRKWNGGLGYPIPAGLHRIRVYLHDNAGANSGIDFEFSTDNITFANIVTTNVFTDKPQWVCNKGYICDGQYFELDKTTPLVLDDFTVLCPPECVSALAPTESDGGGAGGDAFECADEETQAIEVGTNTAVPAGLKTVTINNLTGLTIVAGGYELGTGRRVDAQSLDATNHPCINGVLPAITVTGGTWQWIGIR